MIGLANPFCDVEDGRAGLVARAHRADALDPERSRVEQVLHEQDPEQVVEVVLVHGKVAVTRTPDRSRHVVEGDRHCERNDVHPRCHDLPGRRVPHRLESLANLHLLLGDLCRRLMAEPSDLPAKLHLLGPSRSVN